MARICGARISTWVTIILVSVMITGGARAETLADTLVSAYKNSGLLEQNRALLRAADEDVAQSVANLRPILDWTSRVTHTLEEQPDFTGQVSTTERTDFALGLTAEWLLYDFGRSRLQVEAAKETVLATRQVLLGIEQQVLFRSVEAHINVLRNQENMQLRRNNLGVIREELRAAKERFELGETTQTDIAQAEARLSEAQSGLAAAKRDLSLAIEEYQVAVGRAPGQLKEPTRMPSTDMSEAVAKDVASSRHPDLLKIQREVKAADLNVQIAKAAMRPSINLTGRIGTSREIDGSDYSHSGSVGIEMSGPIYRGGSLSSAHRQAMARRAAARGELHLVSLQVRQNVGNAFARLRAARASRQASRDEVRAARIAFEGIRDEAQYGARTTLDILQSEQRFLNARTNSIFAKADVQIASYAVLAATGKLTARALNLDVPTYDPNTYYELSKTAPVSISPQGDKLDRVIRALGK